ncbi:hypothetical protein B0A48_10249 [Cryoendolithus antarcticus]|uniref:Apple domain-containing protein n=1 Tax=Cryoendolithus antarcticus TaxID=1507870 RepID=A0A1V8SWY2_9PEZI|nr:hypothetical protein B0A48_10249 [Cryoendolithus antarcticus]
MAIDPVSTCTIDNISCPACDGQNITKGGNSNYQVVCGTYLTATHITLQSGDHTPFDCIAACDSTLACTGAHITDGGACSLAMGKIFGKIKLRGYTAFIAIADVPPAAATSSVAEPSSPGVVVTVAASAGTVVSAGPPTPPAPYANNTYSTPFTTHPSPGPGATGIVSSDPPQYDSSNLSSSYPSTGPIATGVRPIKRHERDSTYGLESEQPAPNTMELQLHAAYTFVPQHHPSYSLQPKLHQHDLLTQHLQLPSLRRILCNKRLLSNSRYALAEPLSAAYCLSQCDERNATCVGASWSSDDGCVLATGKINGTVSDPDSTAFIRLGLLPSYSTGTDSLTPVTTQPTWLNMSAYPTGAFTSAHPPIATAPIPYPTGPVTITRTSTLPAPPIETCNPAAIACPACDGLRIVHTQNTTYRLQCNFRPICDELVGAYGTASMNVCMNRCDEEEECVAAVYDHGHCDLCQGSMEGEVDEDVGFLVLVPEEAEGDSGEGTATMTSLLVVQWTRIVGQ